MASARRTRFLVICASEVAVGSAEREREADVEGVSRRRVGGGDGEAGGGLTARRLGILTGSKAAAVVSGNEN